MFAADVSSWRGEVSLLRDMSSLHAPSELIAKQARLLPTQLLVAYLSVPLRLVSIYLGLPFLREASAQTGVLRVIGYALLALVLLAAGFVYADDIVLAVLR